jgi:hypothetical protein
MWSDNETSVDLLGFDYLVDELEVLVTNERLLPLTVLVDGDWGSGKSSLMGVMRDRLLSDENKGRFIVVEFMPWRFEDLALVKVALMAAVVDAIAEHVETRPKDSVPQVVFQKMNRLRGTLQRFGLWKAAATGGLVLAGVSPVEAAAAGALADALGSVAPERPSDDEEIPRDFTSVADFHVVFEELIEALGDDLQAVVVFIDDMDRCSSTSTIVETFEAMRLFLHAPKTAYVVGAQAKSVEAALDSGYVGRTADEDERVAGRWLEKMLQQRIQVPPLGEPDVMTYINLLFCELYTTGEQFAELRALADENRKSNPFGVALNLGMVVDKLGSVPDELVEGLNIAQEIGPVLAEGLRGNPRQTKGFLNDLLRRLKTAERRGMGLEPAKLAKLMVLETGVDEKHFEQLFKWFLAADAGLPVELSAAEKLAREGIEKDCPEEVRQWVIQPGVRRWLRLQPSLADTNLGPYFTFSRSRLSGLITAPRLSLDLQRMLAKLQGDVEAQRVGAVKTASELPDGELAELLPPLVDAAMQRLRGAAATSLLELATKRPEVATAMFDRLNKLPDNKADGTFATNLAVRMKSDSRVRPLLQRWAEKGTRDVKAAAARALDRL